MDKETELIELGAQRSYLIVTNCTNSDVWEALGDAYKVIGAESNAASCYRRAEVYRTGQPIRFVSYQPL